MPRKKNWKAVRACRVKIERMRREGTFPFFPGPRPKVQVDDLRPPSPPKPTVGEIRKQICSEDPAMALINDMWEYWRLSLQDDKVDIPSLTSVCNRRFPYIDWVFAYFIKDIKLPDGREFDQEHVTSFLNHLQKYYCMFKAKTDKQIMGMNSFDHCSKAYKSKIRTIGTYRKNEIEMAWGMLLDLEMNLWNKNVFGTHSAESLVLTLYFYLMKIFGLYLGSQLCCLKMKDVSFGSNMLGQFVEVKADRTYRHYNDPSNPRSFYQVIQTYIAKLDIAGVENGVLCTADSPDEIINLVEDKKLLDLNLLGVTCDQLTDLEMMAKLNNLFSKLKAKAGPRFHFYSIIEIRHWVESKLNISRLGEAIEIGSDGEKYLPKCKLLDPPSDLDLRISSLGNVLKFHSIQGLSSASSQETLVNEEVIHYQPCSTDAENSIEFVCTRDNKMVQLVCSGNKVIHFVCSMKLKKSHTIPFDREHCTTVLSQYKSNDEFCCAAMRDTLVLVSKCSVVATEKTQHHYFKAKCNVVEELLKADACICHTGSQLEEQLAKLTKSTAVPYRVYFIRHTPGNTGHIFHIGKEVMEQCRSELKLRGVIPDENPKKGKKTMKSKQNTSNDRCHVSQSKNKKRKSSKSTFQFENLVSGEYTSVVDLSLEKYRRIDNNEISKDEEISYINSNIVPENTTVQPNELDPLSFTDSEGFATRVEIKKEVEDLICEVEDRNNQPQWREPNKKRKLDEENQLSEPYLEIKVEVEDYLPDANTLLTDKRNDTFPLPPTQIISEPQTVEIKTEVDHIIGCDNSTKEKRNYVDPLFTSQNLGTVKTVEIKNEVKDIFCSYDILDPIKQVDISSPFSNIEMSCIQPLATVHSQAEQNVHVQMPQNIVQTNEQQSIQTLDIVATQPLKCEQTPQQNIDSKTSICIKEDISNSIKETQTDRKTPEVYIDVDHAGHDLDETDENHTGHYLDETNEHHAEHCLDETNEHHAEHRLYETNEHHAEHCLDETNEHHAKHCLDETNEHHAEHCLDKIDENHTGHSLYETNEHHAGHSLDEYR